MDIFLDPTVYGVFKIVGGAIAIVTGIPFNIGPMPD